MDGRAVACKFKYSPLTRAKLKWLEVICFQFCNQSFLRFGLQTITTFDPSFVALHFQECGGKLADENGAENVKDFIRFVRNF